MCCVGGEGLGRGQDGYAGNVEFEHRWGFSLRKKCMCICTVKPEDFVASLLLFADQYCCRRCMNKRMKPRP